MEVSDPIIATLAVVLTFGLRSLAQRIRGRGKTILHYYSPALATLIAVGLQAAWLAMTEDGAIDAAALGRGFLAGCVAVTGHAQYRAILAQVAADAPPTPTPTPTEDSTP